MKPALVFVCVHVANGSPIRKITRSDPPSDGSLQGCPSLNVACVVCADQMDSLGENDIQLVCKECVITQIENFLA